MKQLAQKLFEEPLLLLSVVTAVLAALEPTTLTMAVIAGLVAATRFITTPETVAVEREAVAFDKGVAVGSDTDA
jgi:hypothetical protein